MEEAHQVGNHAGTPCPHKYQCRFGGRGGGSAVVPVVGAIGSGHAVTADPEGREVLFKPAKINGFR